jgi:ribosome biogenesis GTPase
MKLAELGWNGRFEDEFKPFADLGLVSARVVREDRQVYTVVGEQGTLAAEVTGKLRHEAESTSDFPAVGDWVAIQPRADEGKATIHAVLPRKSAFIRKEAGVRTEGQVLAANVDTVFLVVGLDHDFNPRRIERYLAVAWDSGATPVVVLNKADVCPEVAACVETVEAVAMGVPVHVLSAVTGDGLDVLETYARAGRTLAFLGSSGVGKSSLINCLLGENRLEVQAVREDDSRGRHTTTHRELIVLPRGGIVIDTPGMRELQLWDDDGSIERTFEDIETLAGECRFRDCRHETEPGCAVQMAVDAGDLDQARLTSYRKLQRELRHIEARKDEKARFSQRASDKQFGKMIKQMKKDLQKRREI